MLSPYPPLLLVPLNIPLLVDPDHARITPHAISFPLPPPPGQSAPAVAGRDAPHEVCWWRPRPRRREGGSPSSSRAGRRRERPRWEGWREGGRRGRRSDTLGLKNSGHIGALNNSSGWPSFFLPPSLPPSLLLALSPSLPSSFPPSFPPARPRSLPPSLTSAPLSEALGGQSASTSSKKMRDKAADWRRGGRDKKAFQTENKEGRSGWRGEESEEEGARHRRRQLLRKSQKDIPPPDPHEY